VGLLAAYLLAAAPRAQMPWMAFSTLAGVAGWTLTEYALHRFVLHGVAPFRHWHALHHQRPTALICSPTVVTASLFVVLVYLPALLLMGAWHACALTLGMLSGYLGYATMHHALHHWRLEAGWFKRLKHRHALHHGRDTAPACYGVSSGFWDRVFGSAPRAGAPDH
jgi:sterol desaturase/sphingolipid hydroxylase (fatty acid hydroxylase superfamily)